MSTLLSLLPIVIGILAVALLLAILASGYVKSSPDTAFIISGLRKTPKVLIGKAGIRIPFFEKKDELSLQLIPIDVKTSNSVPTADYINIKVDATVNIKIGDSAECISLASQNFLNKRTDYIAQIAREVLEGNIREIVGKMQLEEMVSDRQKFAALVKENAEPDLAAMGLDIICFNVQNFIDNDKVIENLGVDNIVKISKNAAISRAESEKEIAKAQAVARQEANEATIEAEQKIAIRENELRIKQSELKKESDIKMAEADAAYNIQEQEQRKFVEISTADANIAKQTKEIELTTKQIEITEKRLDAEIRKQAEAEKFAKQQNADATLYERTKAAEAKMIETEKQADADKIKVLRASESKKFEAEKNAEAEKLRAEASKYASEQEAEGIKAKGLAEAEAMKAKALAEAEGIHKKAEAMKLMGEAAVLEMYFKALPEIVRGAAEPLSKVDKITMYGEGNSAKLMKDIMGTVTQVNDGLKESSGIDLQSILSGFIGGKLADKK